MGFLGGFFLHKAYFGLTPDEFMFNDSYRALFIRIGWEITPKLKNLGRSLLKKTPENNLHNCLV